MAGRQRRVDAQLLPVQDSGEPPTTGSLAIFDLDRRLRAVATERGWPVLVLSGSAGAALPS